MFANGCPSCGYGSKEQPGGVAQMSAAEQMQQNARKKGHFYVHKQHVSERPARQGDGSLPAWIYVVTLVALAGIIAGVVRCAL